MIRRLCRVLLLLGLSLSPITAHAAPRTATRAVPGDTLTILEASAPDTLDPLLTRSAAGVDATGGVFDALVRIGPDGRFSPDLAARWHRSVDARTWTFYLDPRAHWQDGEPVTADDVAFTAGLVRDARFGAVSTRGFDVVASIVISDTYALTVTLNAAFAPFLATFGTTPILPSHVLGALSPAQVRGYAPFNRHPIGSGPYTVAAFSADGRVVEEANPDYFGGAPRLGRLVFAPAASRRAALDAARHDNATLLPPSLSLTPSDVAPFTGTLPERALYTPGFAWTHLDLIEHGALADPLVRRALALATPRDRIIAQVLGGHGRISDGDQAPGTSAYEPALHNSYRYNPAAARRLLARAGFTAQPDGSMAAPAVVGGPPVPLHVTLWGDAACATCTATLGLIAQGWLTAGISTTINLTSTTALFGAHGPLYDPSRFHAPDYNAVLFAWVNGPDPDDLAYWSRLARVTPSHPLGGNFGGYGNAALDALATRALVTPNGPGRDALYRQIQRILTADEPDVFLYWADRVSVVPAGLSGYDPTPYDSAITWNAYAWTLST